MAAESYRLWFACVTVRLPTRVRAFHRRLHEMAPDNFATLGEQCAQVPVETHRTQGMSAVPPCSPPLAESNLSELRDCCSIYLSPSSITADVAAHTVALAQPVRNGALQLHKAQNIQRQEELCLLRACFAAGSSISRNLLHTR